MKHQQKQSIHELNILNGKSANSLLKSLLQTERFQSLNVAATQVCSPVVVTWLLGWSVVLPPRTTITASSGLSLDGLPKVFPDKVGLTGLWDLHRNCRCHRVALYSSQGCNWLFDEYLTKYCYRGSLGKGRYRLVFRSGHCWLLGRSVFSCSLV